MTEFFRYCAYITYVPQTIGFLPRYYRAPLLIGFGRAVQVPGRFAPNPVRPLSRFAPNPVCPLRSFAPIPVRPGSFRPYSRSPRVVSPRFINSALKNEIWKIPLQIFVKFL